MMQVIYLDILIVTNIIIDYLLLRASAALVQAKIGALRMLLSCLAGGLFSLIILVDLYAPIAALLKTIALIIMVATAFGFKSFRWFLKCCAAFFMANFIFAGVMLALWYKLFPNSVLYKNGVVYFDVSIRVLLISAVICYSVLSVISFFTKRKMPANTVYQVEIFKSNKSLRVKALYDTGCFLKESFSGNPAVIVDKKVIAPIVPEGFESGFESGFEDAAQCIRSKEIFRLIPYSTVKSGGVFRSFKSDCIKIFDAGKWHTVKDVYIAVSEQRITGDFDMIIGTPVFDSINYEETSYEL